MGAGAAQYFVAGLVLGVQQRINGLFALSGEQMGVREVRQAVSAPLTRQAVDVGGGHVLGHDHALDELHGGSPSTIYINYEYKNVMLRA